jgi:CubicO group peptidase (beta-lactamase class C family)
VREAFEANFAERDEQGAPCAVYTDSALDAGTNHGYHAFTYGFLLSEVVRLLTGRRPGQVFAEEIAVPLGLAFWIGLPAEHDAHVPRMIDVEPGDASALNGLPEKLRGPGEAFGRAFADPTSLTYRALRPSGTGFVNADVNDPRVHQAGWAFGGGICDARSLARLYAACVDAVDGVRLLSEQTLTEATAEQGHRSDMVFFYRPGGVRDSCCPMR